VFFDFDKDHVKNHFEDELVTELNEIGVSNVISIEISGHTDSKGSKEYNVDLANRRNANVKEVLPETLNSKISESAHGELKPFAGDDYIDDKREGNNRRVEVLIKYHCGNMGNTVIEAPLTQQEQDQQQLDNFIASNTPAPHIVSFNCIEPQEVQTEEGTLILIPANSFVRADGTTPEEVRMEVREYYDLLSIISGDLTMSTTSGDQLETAGMVYLNATDENGNKLKLAKPLVIGVPYSDETGVKEGMQLYDAYETDEGIKWQLSQVPDFQNPSSLDMNSINLNQPKAMWIDTSGLNIIEQQMAAAAIERLTGKKTPILTDENVDTASINKASEMDRYFFNVTSMGYVNCDRSALKGMGGPDITVKMQRDESYKGAEMTYLIFKDINSVADPDLSLQTKNIATFSKIPEGLDVILISLVVKNGDMFLCKKATTSSVQIIIPVYEAVSEDECKARINGLIQL
jgi:hypothetical protein